MAQHEARANRVTAACRAQAIERADDMASLVQSIDAARAALAGLEASLTARVRGKRRGRPVQGTGQGSVPRPCALERRSVAGNPRHASPRGHLMADPVAAAPSPAMNGAHPAPASGGNPGAVNSRRDVERCLDMIIDILRTHRTLQPDPAPRARMRKMVPKNFLQLMEEIAPSGMKEFKNVAGVDDKTKSAPQ